MDKYSLLYLLVSLLSMSYSIAQDGSIRADYLNEIDSVKACIVAQRDMCDESFSRAIASAESTDNDSLLSHCYLRIYDTQKALGMGYESKWKSLTKAADILESLQYDCLRSQVYSEMGNTILDSGVEQDFMTYYHSALEIGESCTDPRTLVVLRMAMARGLQSKGDFVGAINELLQAEQIATKEQDLTSLAQVQMGLGNVYNLNEDHDLARSHYKESADVILQTGDTMRYWYVMINYAHISNTMDEPQKAIQVLPPAIDYMRQAGMDNVLPYALSQLGRSYGLQGNEELAIQEFQASADISEDQGNMAQSAYNYLCIAEMNKRLDKNAEALDFAVRSYEIYKQAGRAVDLMDAAEIRAEMLGVNGDYRGSVEAYQEYILLKDSLFSDSKMKEISALQAALALEERENEICAQEAEIDTLVLDNKVIRNRNLFLLAALLSLAAFGYALLSRQRLKTAAQKSKVREKDFENERLSKEMEFKNRELSAKALHIAQKNELLQKLHNDLEAMAQQSGAQSCVQEVVNTLKLERTIVNNWDQFTQQFTALNPDFYKNLTQASSSIGKSDLRLAALLRMSLSSKEIASMLNISDEGVKKARYRLRKKLSLQSDDNLEAVIASI